MYVCLMQFYMFDSTPADLQMCLQGNYTPKLMFAFPIFELFSACFLYFLYALFLKSKSIYIYFFFLQELNSPTARFSTFLMLCWKQAQNDDFT